MDRFTFLHRVDSIRGSGPVTILSSENGTSPLFALLYDVSFSASHGIHLSFGYHFFTSPSAHCGVLSVWQMLQLLGSPFSMVTLGEMKSNV